MKTVQIIQDAYEAPISGGDLRNEAILRCLRQFGGARQISMVAVPVDGSASGDAALRQALISDPPDLIVVEGVALIKQAEIARALCPKALIVIDFHNVESALLRELDRARLPVFLRWLAPIFYGKRLRRALALDQRALNLADAIWLCSAQDAVRTRELGKAEASAAAQGKLAVVPNIMPKWCEEFTPETARAAPQLPEILYLGHLGYPPNKVAVRWLVRHILPALRKRFSSAHLIVAGRSPNTRLRRFLARFSYVELVSDPAELAPLYVRADMALIPLKEGGGSRIKVLEALAVGCPIVATAKAVEGVGLIPKQHFLLAETPAQFATAVARLMDDPALRDKLRREGIAFSQQTHSAAAIKRAITQALTPHFPDMV